MNDPIHARHTRLHCSCFSPGASQNQLTSLSLLTDRADTEVNDINGSAEHHDMSLLGDRTGNSIVLYVWYTSDSEFRMLIEGTDVISSLGNRQKKSNYGWCGKTTYTWSPQDTTGRTFEAWEYAAKISWCRKEALWCLKKDPGKSSMQACHRKLVALVFSLIQAAKKIWSYGGRARYDDITKWSSPRATSSSSTHPRSVLLFETWWYRFQG